MNAIETKQILDADCFYRSELGSHAKLNRKGWCVGGLCPFHEDKRLGSFYVNTSTGAFNCFSCGSKGDVFKFVQLRYGYDFRSALAYIGARYG